jgi:hypothetical protein
MPERFGDAGAEFFLFHSPFGLRLHGDARARRETIFSTYTAFFVCLLRVSPNSPIFTRRYLHDASPAADSSR